MKKSAIGNKSKASRKLAAKDRAAVQIFQTASEKLLSVPIVQKPSAKLALAKKSQMPSDQLAIKEYQLYLPSKELLRQKLLDWTREQEGKA